MGQVKKARGPFDFNFLISLFLALAVWMGLRNDVIWESFVGEADREAIQIAFAMRVNRTLEGTGPILFLNLDDSVWHGEKSDSPPLAYAPRPVIYKLLRDSFGTPGFPRPKLVIADFDLFWRTPDEEAESRIDALLEEWGRDPEAPLLVLQREVVDGDGTKAYPAAIRPSARDRFINEAPEGNIVWASALFTGDEVIGARYFEHFLCLKSDEGPGVVASTALYAVAARRSASAREAVAQVDAAMEQPLRYCAGEGSGSYELEVSGRDALFFSGQRSLINYSARPQGDFDFTSPGLIAADMFVIPAAAVSSEMVGGLAANSGIVIIGSASLTARDRHITPYGPMGGSLIIANTVRGLEVGGQVHRLHWIIEASLLSVFVSLIVLAFWYCRLAREIVDIEPASEVPWYVEAYQIPFALLTNPVIVKILIGVSVFWLGALATYYMLDYGLWIGFAAPAYAAALNEAREDFEELMENLREKKARAK